jgi:two-component system, cell cycle sensor histidine kinase and response regulator CckA
MPSSRLERAVEPLSNLSLNAKGVLVVAIPVCALLLAMGVYYQFQRQMRAAQVEVVHSYETSSQLRQTLMQLVNAETSIRGYLLTHEDEFLQPYLTARREMPGHFTALQSLLANNLEDLAKLDRIQKLAEVKLADLEAYRQLARPDLNDLSRDKATMDELWALLAELDAESRRDLAASSAHAHQARVRTEIGIFAGGVLGLVGGILAILLFTSRISRRVERVEEAARQVAKGVPLEREVTGSDEIADLERTLQQTSRLLNAQSEELRSARDEMQARVIQRTMALQKANDELHEANAVRQAIITSVPLAIWAIDLEGNITFWNPGAEGIFGWSEAEVIGTQLPALPPEQQDEYASWLKRFRRGESLTAVERTRLKKDGSRMEAAIWTTPLRDAEGRVTGTILIDTDVTERKLLEQQYRESQKLEAVGRLAGGVAHDFNNLLTVIMGYVEMLIAAAGDQPTLVEYAQEVQDAAKRASALTAELLAFGRRRISQPKPINLNDVINQSMKMLRRIIGEDTEISAHLDPRLEQVQADPSHVNQMIMNLVVNARDAMPNGGIVTIDTANVILDDNYAARHISIKPGRYCMLAIGDTGIGMTGEVRSRLFEPFFTTKEAGKGTGLGLSIVFGIVKQSGGEIMVYSEPGEGTTFKIYLPSIDVVEETPVATARPAVSHGHETVLVCEDEAGIRKLVVSMLSQQGYSVLDAEAPDDAIRIASRTRETIHLLLTDVVMPKMNGFDLAIEVRKLHPHIKVLYMSGYTDSRVGASWQLQDGTAFLQKPFIAEALARKVREVLEMRDSGSGGPA